MVSDDEDEAEVVYRTPDGTDITFDADGLRKLTKYLADEDKQEYDN